MKYIIIAALIALIIIIKAFYDKKNRMEKAVKKLKETWGNVPQEEYTSEKLKSIRFFYDTRCQKDIDVDDITWNDLDMDQIYMTINNTCSSIGEEYLYSMLRKPKFSQNELNEEEVLIEAFQKNSDLRLKVQVILKSMGKSSELSVYEYINRLNNVDKENNLKHYIVIMLIILSIGTMFVNFAVGILALIICLFYNIISYFRRKQEIENYFYIVKYIIKWLNATKELTSIKSDVFDKYNNDLLELYKQFGKFKMGSSVVSTTVGSGGLTDIFMDYVRILLHVDIIKFNSMIDILDEKKEYLNKMFEIIGFIDSMIGIASYRMLIGQYCIPELDNSSTHHLNAKGIYHPMLSDPVTNSFNEERSALITGSNASGKSTFIKTLAINCILAQTINTVSAENYSASFFRVASSMALQDNLAEHESYYIVEIKSLKRIMDLAQGNYPLLCFVDEVLRGTNTLERIAASSRILNELAKCNAICIAATHDIELTHILEDSYSNYHFQEQIINNDIIFDYLLHEGRAISKNAIKLLEIMGFKHEVTDDASEAANYFLEHGEWGKCEV